MSAYSADLENERKEIARMRQEETERHSQHKEAIDDFRAEIARLHGELRAAGLVDNLKNKHFFFLLLQIVFLFPFPALNSYRN